MTITESTTKPAADLAMYGETVPGAIVDRVKELAERITALGRDLIPLADEAHKLLEPLHLASYRVSDAVKGPGVTVHQADAADEAFRTASGYGALWDALANLVEAIDPEVSFQDWERPPVPTSE